METDLCVFHLQVTSVLLVRCLALCVKHESLLLGQVEIPFGWLWQYLNLRVSEGYQLIVMRPCILYIVTHESPPVVLKETDLFLQMVFKCEFLIAYSIKIFFLWQLNLFPLGPVFQSWCPRQISLYCPTLSSSKHRGEGR